MDQRQTTNRPAECWRGCNVSELLSRSQSPDATGKASSCDAFSDDFFVPNEELSPDPGQAAFRSAMRFGPAANSNAQKTSV